MVILHTIYGHVYVLYGYEYDIFGTGTICVVRYFCIRVRYCTINLTVTLILNLCCNRNPNFKPITMVTQTLALLQRQLLDIPGSSSHLSPPAITLILKRECHDNQWFLFSHFVWGKIMAATRKDRGNSWASRAPLNDDRAPIVAKLVEATFSSWACRWGPGGCFVVCWLVDSLYPPPNCGLERTSRFQRWHRPSKDLFRGVVKRRLAFFFFFFFFC